MWALIILSKKNAERYRFDKLKNDDNKNRSNNNIFICTCRKTRQWSFFYWLLEWKQVYNTRQLLSSNQVSRVRSVTEIYLSFSKGQVAFLYSIRLSKNSCLSSCQAVKYRLQNQAEPQLFYIKISPVQAVSPKLSRGKSILGSFV